MIILHSHTSSYDDTHRFYTQTDLSSLVNQLETFLGTSPQSAYASTQNSFINKPGLNLVLLIERPQIRNKNSTKRLRFHLPRSTSIDADDVQITNVALIPQWGGLILIDNDQNLKFEYLTAYQMIHTIRSILGVPQIDELLNLTIYQQMISSKMKLFGRITNWEV